MRCDAQADIDELVRKQRFIGIGELGLELDRSGRRIDLVIDRAQ